MLTGGTLPIERVLPFEGTLTFESLTKTDPEIIRLVGLQIDNAKDFGTFLLLNKAVFSCLRKDDHNTRKEKFLQKIEFNSNSCCETDYYMARFISALYKFSYLISRSNSQKHGLYTISIGGKVKIEYNYHNGEKHGVFKDFYYNGELRREGMYVNGKREGLWKYFHWRTNPDEPLKIYKQGKYVADIKEGVWEQWNGAGLKCDSLYIKGIPSRSEDDVKLF